MDDLTTSSRRSGGPPLVEDDERREAERFARVRRRQRGWGVGGAIVFVAVAAIAVWRPTSATEDPPSPDFLSTAPAADPSSAVCSVEPSPPAIDVGLSLTVSFDSGDLSTFEARETTATVHLENVGESPITVRSDGSIAVVPIDPDGRVVRRPQQVGDAVIADLELAPGETGTRVGVASAIPCSAPSATGRLAAVADVILSDGTRMRVAGEFAT